MKISSKKKMAAVAITIAALSLGSIAGASADEKSAAKGERHAAVKALVSTTIGLDSATIKARRIAGESLGTIAGAKKDELLTALVAYKSQKIDARVAEGKITAAQASQLKAELTTKITARVDSVKAPKPAKVGKTKALRP